MPDKDLLHEKMIAFIREEFSLDSQEVFFSLTDGTGIMLTPDMFTNGESTSPPTDAQVDEVFSGLVNGMPIYSDDLSFVRCDSFYQLDEFYEQLMLDARVKQKDLGEPTATDLRTVFDRKKNDAIRSFEDARRLGDDQIEYHLSNALPQQWYTGKTGRKNHTIEVEATPQATAGKKPLQFLARPADAEIKKLQDNTDQSKDIADKRKLFISKFGRTNPFHAGGKSPADRKSTTDALVKSAGHFTTWAGKPAPAVMGHPPQPKAKTIVPRKTMLQTSLIPALSAIADRQDVMTQKLSIAFEYLDVKIKRDWMDEVFLSDPSWYVPGSSKGNYSIDPATDSIAPSLYAVPVSIVLVRNVVIRSNAWTARDTGMIDKSMGLSFLNLQSAAFDGNAISIPTMQMIGTTNRKLSILPPNDPD